MSIHKLTTNSFENQIDNIIRSTFPNLNNTDSNLLLTLLINLVNIIGILFSFDLDQRELYLKQFASNEYQDIKWLLFHLLPYINLENDITKIISLSDIYTKKKENVDINQKEPKYLYSNLQYNRCIRDNNKNVEIKYDRSHIIENYYFLIKTLRMSANKLCVNWVNILPLTTKTYNQSRVYKNTIDRFVDKKYTDWNYEQSGNVGMICDELAEKATGLYIGQIYDEINSMYMSIKDYKWIIYDIKEGNGSIKPVSMIIPKLFPRSHQYLLKNKQWDELESEVVDLVNYDLENILDGYINNKGVDRLSSDVLNRYVSGFVKSFEKSRFRNIAISDGYIPITVKKYDEEEIYNVSNQLLEQSIYTSYGTLKNNYIYDYMIETIEIFKKTWFGYYLLNKNKTEFLRDNSEIELIDITTASRFDFSEASIDNEEKPNKRINDIFWEGYTVDGGVYPLPKYIYNFCKSFVHNTEKDEFVKYPDNWVSLSDEQKEVIMNKLNGVVFSKDWFNITHNIKNDGYNELFNSNITYAKLFEIDQRNKFKTKYAMMYVNNYVYGHIKVLLIDIVFQSLIHKGVLSEFRPDLTKSEKKTLNGNLENIVQLESQKKLLTASDNNEYWTSAYHYFTYLPYNCNNNIKEDNKLFNYFSYGLKRAWYVAGAYDWIGQIGFCHHFINNRITFITGGTGVGKSTEVPKLYVYYSKALDNKISPAVVCTQPRQNAVEENANRVSTTLGVQIGSYEDGINIDDHFIQFKHKNRAHLKRVSHPYLLYITGDSLVNELQGNIVLKKPNEKNKGYTLENQYDVIMIDEAHEHKKHMDILMTSLKLPISLNNSVKMIIVSATMDDDESRYRNYFRNINDNKKFPLDYSLLNNKLDKINIDRRYHIAPPGAGTRFVIKEHYRPLLNNVSVFERIKEIVLEIIKSSTEGDILIFQPGMNEILETLKILNKAIPENMLALPYNRELPETHKKLIQGLERTRKQIKYDKFKNGELTLYGAVKINDSNVTEGTNSYKRFIVVSTNIAEASITIGSLKYVIDTGTENFLKYDYKTRANNIEKQLISESSRRQRKGRVGRVSSGTVYYTYEEGATENNKIPYEFALSDISDIIYKNLCETEEENEYSKLNFDNEIIDITEYKGELQYFIQSHYYLNDIYYNYVGNENMYDYRNYEKSYKYYKNGYMYGTIIDELCKFYIIHPNETDLIRNISGNIVGVKTDDISIVKNKLVSKKINNFFNMLFDFRYIEMKDIVQKTELGMFYNKKEVSELITDGGLLRVLMNGLSMNYFDVIKFCAFCESSNFNFADLYNTYKEEGSEYMKSKFLIMKQKYQDVKSDGEIMIKILNEFHLLVPSKHKTDPEQEMEIIKNDTRINEWCVMNEINKKNLLKYYKRYLQLFSQCDEIMKNKELIQIFKSKYFYSKTPDNKLLTCIILSYPQNICKRINETRKYLSIYTPDIYNIYTIPEFGGELLQTFMNKIYISNYVAYMYNNKNNISILFYLDKKDLLNIGHVYNKKYYDNIKNYVVKFDKSKFVNKFMDLYNESVKMNKPKSQRARLEIIGTESNNILINYIETLNSL